MNMPRIRGTNQSDPFLENRKSHNLLRLLQGISLLGKHWLEDGARSQFRLGDQIRISIKTAQFDYMRANGFHAARPHVTVIMHLQPEAHPENWAGLTAAEMVRDEYELAPRITVSISWVDAQGQVKQLFLRLSTLNRSSLERALLTVSLYEYAAGILVPNTTDVGPRRFDAFRKPTAAQARSKVWELIAPRCETCQRSYRTWASVVGQHHEKYPLCKDAWVKSHPGMKRPQWVRQKERN